MISSRRRRKKRTNRNRQKKRAAYLYQNRKVVGLVGMAAVFFLIVLAVLANGSDGREQAELPVRIHLLEDQSIAVWDEDAKETVQMGLEEYIVHAVAGEMPASYESEALKAQAVAARTYTVRKMRSVGGAGCDLGDEADVCTSSAHCQAYLSTEEMQQRWGEEYETYLEKITQAVSQTAGEIMLYDGKPIEALYFASSGGKTENAENVFSNAKPYLVSVDSPGEGTMGKNEGSVTVTYDQFVKKIQSLYPEISLSATEVQQKTEIKERYESGRVKTVSVAGEEISGKEMRSLFTLNSTNFTIRYGADSLTFETKGYGHGVGMSQAGANAMAQSGEDYASILTHYYTGAALGKIESEEGE